MAVKWSNEVRIYLGGFDLSTAGVSSSIELAAPALDKTGLSDAAESAIAGARADKAGWAGWFEDSAQSVDAVIGSLIGSGTGDHFTMMVGTGTGARAYMGTAMVRSVKPDARIGNLVHVAMGIDLAGSVIPMKHFGPRVNTTSGQNSGTTDDTTGTSGTGYFGSHVFVYSGTLGTVNVNLEHSTDGTTWANKVTHTYTSGAGGSFTATAGSQITTFTGSLNRYVRMSSGSATATGTFNYFGAYRRP